MRMIPPVSVDLLMCADRKVAADHEAGLPPDPTVSIISTLHGKCGPEEMIAIECRLTALDHLLVDGDGRAWAIHVDGKDYTLVAGALIRAAATAPPDRGEDDGRLALRPRDSGHCAARC